MQVEPRKAIESAPPQLPGMTLRNVDVANFQGLGAGSCNRRQLVFWDTTDPVPERLVAYVQLQFHENRTVRRGDLLKGRGARLVRQADALFGIDKRAPKVRFGLGSTLVTVSAGCVRDDVDLLPAPCTLKYEEAALRAHALDAATALQPQLSEVL